MQTRKQVRANRLWKHWLSWLPEKPFDPDLRRIDDYDPKLYRRAFEWFQSNGRRGLTPDQLRGIHPLIDAQKAKEITLTSLAEESMEWWANGWGWIHPWSSTLESGRIDRLTRVAVLRTMKSIEQDPHAFFERHPGISQEKKWRYFRQRVAALS
jgi:hypothetical protein